MYTFRGPRLFDADSVSVKISQVNGMFPALVRLHGTCSSGAPYRTWHILDLQNSAPRAGLRLLNESGLAANLQQDRKFQPYRHCGGPKSSNRRDCLAQPDRAGPVTKERLVTIQKAIQQEFTAVARAKAVVRSAEAEIGLAFKDVMISRGLGFELLSLMGHV